MSNSQTYYHFKLDFQKVDQHTGGNIKHVTLAANAAAANLVLTHLIKSLHNIWRLDSLRSHLLQTWINFNPNMDK